MAAVIEALREEHRNIALLLDALEHQVGVFARGGDPDYDVVRGIAEYFLDYPDRCHHPKEDVVFARLEAVDPRGALAIGDLTNEHRVVHRRAHRFHEVVSELLNESDIARSDVVDAANEFIEAQRRHMRMEDEYFFALAERRLTQADWSTIEDKIAKRDDTLFGGKVEEQFRNLSERLIAWEHEYSGERQAPKRIGDEP